ANSNLIQEIGRYGQKPFPGNRMLPTLVDPEKTRVYESKPGMRDARAATFKKQSGPSFHFILNDVITKDNRIPPRGFQNARFAEHLAAPVGTEYQDGQYWDELQFPLPTGAEQVEIRLMYQSVSAEYVYFLFEQNESDSWGKKLFDAWQVTGQCPPEPIATVRTACTPAVA